jgi:hypothetical protein
MDTSAIRIENPYIAGLTLEVGFDNANPREAFEVQVRGDGTCVVHQFIEPEAAEGYAFHLHLALENAGREPVTVPLQIHWAEREYDFCYDYMYVGYDSGRDWKMLSTRSEKAITQLQLVLPRGRHLLCCHPKFDTGDYLAMLEQYGGAPGFKRVDVAKTPEGRPVACLRLGNPKGRKTVITTRAHGYETAGAYCLAGWLKYISKHATKRTSPLDALDLYVFPMVNPDAVAAGHCCTAPSGVNFGRELASRADEDSGAEGLTEFIHGLKPAFYVDMHNNTGPHLVDAFRSTDERILEAFAKKAPDRSRDQKAWAFQKVQFPEGYMLTECERRYGTLPLLTEFPWYTRLPGDMMAHGSQFLRALLPLLAEWRYV